MKTILLVEDDFLNRRITKKLLAGNGYRVLESKNALEAFERLRLETIDLAILDIHLGEGERDGISISQQIQEKHKVPFIFLTAYDNQEIINKALFSNPFSYLTKPFKNVDLINSVEIALRKSVDHFKPKPSIVVKDEDYQVELPIEAINHIESDGNYLNVYTDKKTYRCRSTIKNILDSLPETSFVQVHRAFIVNKHKITKYTIKSVVVNNIELPMSSNYSESFNS